MSGALALLRSQFDASVDHLKFREALFASAKDLGSTGDDSGFGRGLVKVDEAMTLMLNNNDDRTANAIKFSTANYVFAEDETSVEISLLRAGDISTAVSTTIISENGTATSGSDFVPVSATVDFIAGESLKTISIQLVNDNLGENTESFNLIISTNNLKKKINITDDDTGSEEDEDDIIGGSSSGIFQLFFLFMLWLGRRALR